MAIGFCTPRFSIQLRPLMPSTPICALLLLKQSGGVTLGFFVTMALPGAQLSNCFPYFLHGLRWRMLTRFLSAAPAARPQKPTSGRPLPVHQAQAQPLSLEGHGALVRPLVSPFADPLKSSMACKSGPGRVQGSGVFYDTVSAGPFLLKG